MNNKLIDRKTLAITTLLTLSTALPGLLLWDRLPDTIATHFGLDGTPDGWSSKLTAVILLPLIMTGLQLFCVAAFCTDPKRKNLRKGLINITLWCMPVTAIIVQGSVIATAMGTPVDMHSCAFGIMGLVFTVLGNYMPKMQQNYTMGIKIPWTLASEDNWNRTHRMAGKLWVAGGLIIIADMFFRLLNDTALIVILMTISLTPIAYSFLIFVKSSGLEDPQTDDSEA